MSSAQSRLPTEEEIAAAKAYSRELAKYADKQSVRMRLISEGQSSDDFALPDYLVELMIRVTTEVSMGHGVSILPTHTELTTQQAANLLNVSRPFLVNLLENGSIPHRKVGSHRRVLAQDVLVFQDKQQREREETLDELAALSDEICLYDKAPGAAQGVLSGTPADDTVSDEESMQSSMQS